MDDLKITHPLGRGGVDHFERHGHSRTWADGFRSGANLRCEIAEVGNAHHQRRAAARAFAGAFGANVAIPEADPLDGLVV